MSNFVMYAPAVIKKGSKWYRGFINGDAFEEKEEIQKLADVQEISEYQTLKMYLRSYGVDVSLCDVVMKNLDCDSVYILDMPVDLTIPQFTKWWWSFINPICKDCIGKCKQSSRVILHYCPSFKKK